jgi:hypothetical protein
MCRLVDCQWRARARNARPLMRAFIRSASDLLWGGDLQAAEPLIVSIEVMAEVDPSGRWDAEAAGLRSRFEVLKSVNDYRQERAGVRAMLSGGVL